MIKKIINWAAVIIFCFIFLASISQSPEPDYLPASVILIGAILWAAIQGILWLYKTVDRKSILIGIILVGLSIRLVWAIFVPSLPVSDFLTYHNAALQLSENTPVTQKNMGYIVLLSLGYRLFPNILTGKIINVIFSTISIILVYSIGKKLIDQKIGLIAATLLAVFPSEIMMVGVLGTEISTTTLYLAIVRCLLEIDNKKTEKQRILWAILTGLFLGLGYTIRSSTIFYLPGILLWILLIKDIKFSRKAIYLGTLILGMVVGLSIIASQLSIISGEFSLTSLNAQDMYPLLSGTNFTSSGQYNQEDVLLYFSWPEDNRDYLAIQTAINRITSSPQRFSLLVLRKWARMMGENTYSIPWAIETIDWGSGNMVGIFATDTAPWDRSWEDLLPLKGYLITICRLLLQTPYILVWFFALPALKNFGENKLGPIVFAIVLLTLLPHTVLEVQGRYHHYMMPFIILLASFGYTHFLDHGIKKSEV